MLKPTTTATTNGYVIAKPNEFETLWCCYEHWTATPNGPMMFYVGCCRLIKAFEFTDARKNTAWLEMMKSDIMVEVRVVATGKRVDCNNRMMEAVRTHQPYCNKQGMRIGKEKRAVVCDLTGQQYASAKECAAAEGIAQSSLSNHLNNLPGYSTVRGKTYRWGT